MAKIKNKKRSVFEGIILAVAILGLLLFHLSNGRANNIDCDILTGDDKDKCESLDKKADTYRDLIDIKNKQQNSLQNQLTLINTEQDNLKAQIQDAKNKSDELVQQMLDLQRDIDAKEDMIDSQKKILAGLIQTYYQYYQDGLLEIVLSNKDFADEVDQEDYVGQASSRVKEVLDSIQQAKAGLEKEQNDLRQKKQESDQLNEALLSKNVQLKSTEDRKQTLLTQTQGEQQKYEKLLARVEAQKLELFDFSAAGNVNEVIASVGNYPKPKDHLASTSWYFSQRDPDWGAETIGNSNSLMRDYGCAVTSVAMVFRYYGAKLDPGSLAKQKIFYYDLIEWPDGWSPSIELASSTSHGNINWKTVDSEIAKGHPVILYIQKTNGRGGHYVVVHNKDSHDYIVHDPFFGSNLYLGTSRALMGMLGSASGTTINQMIIYNK